MAWGSRSRHVPAVRLNLDGLEARETPAVVGAPDPAFGVAGKLLLAGTPVNAVAVQADGKVVAVGSSGGNFLIERFNADGSFDTAFGTGGTGKVLVDVETAGQVDVANAVKLDSTGRIVVAGTGGSVAGNFALVRLSADGRIVEVNKSYAVGSAASAAVGVDLQTDGTIVLAGNAVNPAPGGDQDAAVLRVNPISGAAVGAATFIANTGIDTATGLAVYRSQPHQDRIVVTGTAVGASDNDIFLARLNADGTPDTSFNAGSFTHLYNLGGPTDAGGGVAIDTSNNIVAVGTTLGADATPDMVVFRVLSSNSGLDSTFNAGGVRKVAVTGQDDGRAVAVQADGKIVAVGDTGGVASDVLIVRLNADGSFDPSFGTKGVTRLDVAGTSNDRGNAVAIGSTGRIVVAGTGPLTDGFIARLTSSVNLTKSLTTSGGNDGRVSIYSPSANQFNTTATATLPSFTTAAVSVRSTTGDVDGDGITDTIMVTGPGTAIRVEVVSGKDNSTVLVAPFDPFGGNFTGGGFVSAADFDGDGRAEFLVTPDQGGGPRVVVYSVVNGSAIQKGSFFGIEDPDFRGGARASAGDVNGDGTPDVVVSAGYGGGPRIAVFDGKTVFSGKPTHLSSDFFAFEPVLRNGAYVAVGDIDGDGFGDLVFGSGIGGGPRVFAISGKTLLTAGVDPALAAPIANFFAGDPNGRAGVRVALKDVDGDNKADLVTGTGNNVPSQVRLYLGKNAAGAAGEPTGVQILDPFGKTLPDGVFVG